jgi:predicted RNase H-like nuclease
VVVDAAGAYEGAVLAATLADLVAAAGEVAVVGVDMPIGSVAGGRRAADAAARAVLGPRRSSIFWTPPPEALAAAGYAEANAGARAATGRGLSRQAWNLVPKMREAAALADAGRVPLREVHPEVSFAAMAGAPLPAPKKTWAGAVHRARLLADHGVRLPDDLGPAGAAPVDDVLDAAAVAWSARRIAAGTAVTYPDPPERDGRGRPVAIWC